MTDQEIVTLLDFYGHLRSPFGQPRGLGDVSRYDLNDRVVRDAVESFKSFHAPVMEPILAAFYPNRLSSSIKINGEMDEVTRSLLSTSRCKLPDYDMSLPEELVGAGNWKRCHNIGEAHCAIVRFLNDPPSFLQPVMDTVWNRVVDAYSQVGLLLRRDDNSTRPNITIEFVQPDGGWIGLAIVGQNITCSDTIWARFDRNYRPENIISEWTTLILHEIGHNCGLSHSSGGIMNPYIIKGLAPTWQNDPSYPLMKSRFGGVPVPTGNPNPRARKMVTAWLYDDGEFDVIQTVPTTGVDFWP